MSVAILSCVLSLTCCAPFGRCAIGAVGAQTQAKDESPQGGFPATIDTLYNSRSKEEIFFQTLLGSSVWSTASSASPPQTTEDDGRLLPSSLPGAPSPSAEPATTRQGMARPSPTTTEEMIDGLSVKEREFRIAMLRKQLQEKLGLTNLPPPPDKPYRILPNAIKKRLIGQRPPQRDLPRYEPRESEITEVLSYAENDTSNCPELGYCFRFRFVRDIIGKPIKSIHLWMFLTPPSAEETNRSPARRLTVWLLRTGDSFGAIRKELATKVVNKREGWFHLELPEEKNAWGSLEHRLMLTKASTDLLTDTIFPDAERNRLPPVSLARDELPILTLTVDVDRQHHRSRRQSQTCQAETDTCCLQLFQVELSDVLGGIVQYPDTIFANFCRGSCFTVANFGSVHAKVMRDRALIETDTNLQQDLVPCCVPATYDADESMVILQSNGALVRREVPEISALSCSCK